MNDFKESLFVGNVIGALSAILYTVLLRFPGLRFTFTYIPLHKILTTQERVLPSKWRWVEHTARLSSCFQSRNIDDSENSLLCYPLQIHFKSKAYDHLFLHAYQEIQSSSCSIIPYPARLPPSLHEDAVTIIALNSIVLQRG
ncbi:hypothetical protein ARMSODRAFT_1019901 [Armillaria solidipes]|uniref:Uncharacterized protein n=1 Tax=Armillaria solidipes TaxID=1076256 RepID=A0A2H3BZ72_9AGAR|nr:hypothetical protein ARMSODRAFT_1019901 [Armillaria solidipes]